MMTTVLSGYHHAHQPARATTPSWDGCWVHCIAQSAHLSGCNQNSNSECVQGQSSPAGQDFFCTAQGQGGVSLGPGAAYAGDRVQDDMCTGFDRVRQLPTGFDSFRQGSNSFRQHSTVFRHNAACARGVQGYTAPVTTQLPQQHTRSHTWRCCGPCVHCHTVGNASHTPPWWCCCRCCCCSPPCCRGNVLPGTSRGASDGLSRPGGSRGNCPIGAGLSEGMGVPGADEQYEGLRGEAVCNMSECSRIHTLYSYIQKSSLSCRLPRAGVHAGICCMLSTTGVLCSSGGTRPTAINTSLLLFVVCEWLLARAAQIRLERGLAGRSWP